MKKKAKKKTPYITVAGVRITASDVKSAVVIKDGREVHIQEYPEENRQMGFHNKS